MRLWIGKCFLSVMRSCALSANVKFMEFFCLGMCFSVKYWVLCVLILIHDVFVQWLFSCNSTVLRWLSVRRFVVMSLRSIGIGYSEFSEVGFKHYWIDSGYINWILVINLAHSLKCIKVTLQLSNANQSFDMGLQPHISGMLKLRLRSSSGEATERNLPTFAAGNVCRNKSKLMVQKSPLISTFLDWQCYDSYGNW